MAFTQTLISTYTSIHSTMPDLLDMTAVDLHTYIHEYDTDLIAVE